MSKRIKDAVFSTKFVNSAGETKFNNTKIGSVIKCDNGSVMLMLDFIPTDLSKGVIMLFDIKVKEQAS